MSLLPTFITFYLPSTHVNKHIPDYPKVKLFYDVKAEHFIKPTEINLAKIKRVIISRLFQMHNWMSSNSFLMFHCKNVQK